jgi:hypothetical protein
MTDGNAAPKPSLWPATRRNISNDPRIIGQSQQYLRAFSQAVAEEDLGGRHRRTHG